MWNVLQEIGDLPDIHTGYVTSDTTVTRVTTETIVTPGLTIQARCGIMYVLIGAGVMMSCD